MSTGTGMNKNFFMIFVFFNDNTTIQPTIRVLTTHHLNYKGHEQHQTTALVRGIHSGLVFKLPYTRDQ